MGEQIQAATRQLYRCSRCNHECYYLCDYCGGCVNCCERGRYIG